MEKEQNTNFTDFTYHHKKFRLHVRVASYVLNKQKRTGGDRSSHRKITTISISVSQNLGSGHIKDLHSRELRVKTAT